MTPRETGFVILDEQGRVRDANREFSHLAGEASSDAMRGRDMLEWVDPRLIDEVRLGLAQMPGHGRGAQPGDALYRCAG